MNDTISDGWGVPKSSKKLACVFLLEDKSTFSLSTTLPEFADEGEIIGTMTAESEGKYEVVAVNGQNEGARDVAPAAYWLKKKDSVLAGVEILTRQSVFLLSRVKKDERLLFAAVLASVILLPQ